MAKKSKNMRQQFLDAIEADPYDLATRKVFADWLDEYGDEKDADLAAVQRAWTKEKQDAIVWLTEFAAELNAEMKEIVAEYAEEFGEEISGDDQFTYQELIEAASAYVKNGKEYYLPFDTPERVFTDNDEFWRMFELATDQKVADEQKRDTFFRCAC
jgi:uncharacterized protein (TIGR02996 family)